MELKGGVRMTYKHNEWGAVAFPAFLGVLLIFLGGWVGRQNVAALQTLVEAPCSTKLRTIPGSSVIGRRELLGRIRFVFERRNYLSGVLFGQDWLHRYATC
jgi:hypothetical protein